MSTQEGADRGAEEREPVRKARYLRIKVVDTAKDGRPAVNIRVPIGVVKWGMKVAQAFSPDVKAANLDWDAITAVVEEGVPGEIVHVEDEAEHETVDVWVE
ncbi:MAG TPA: hypothetical protein VE990_01870 [Acidimicrobiales bacterium]|nr:hypothetical protein [Acidimicrobiales bacterium]